METGKINGNSVVLSNNRTTIIECPGDRETFEGGRVRHERARFLSKTRFEVEEGEAASTRTNLLRKFLQNRKFRHKVLHTICVGLSMIAMGWRQALIGPTFPDLMLIVHQDLSTASWIFTTWSLGNLLGSMCGGAMYDRMNRLTVFIFLLIGLAVTTAMTPWCTGYATMLLIHILGGLFSGAIDAACTTDVLHVWQQESGPYMQGVHFGFSLGAIISPLTSSSFLAKRLQHNTKLNSTFLNSTIVSTNLTSLNALSEFSSAPPISFEALNTTDIPLPEYGETRIHSAYLISSILSFTTACLFGILFFVLGSVYEKMNKREMPDQSTKVHTYPLSRNLKIVFSILVAAMLMLYVIIERHFYSFLMVYVIKSLHWSKTKGSNATAAFWLSFSAGRLTAIFIVKRFTQSCILVTYLILVIIGVVGFSISVISNIEELIWISIVIFGIGMSPIFASIFSWFADKVLKITGKITGILYLCSAVGTMLLPLLTGFLMSKVSYNWYLYLLIMLVVLLLTLFIAVDTVYKYLIKVK